MKVAIFLMSIVAALAIQPPAFSQSNPPVRDTRTAPVKIVPRPTPGKAPVGPKELPEAKLVITSLSYVEVPPGARITIKNAGGKTSSGMRLTIRLVANRKSGGKWADISGNMPWSPFFDPVWCPYDAKGVGSGMLALNQPTLAGTKEVPDLKGGESVTLSANLDHLAYRKVAITSLVDFATQNNCRPYNMGATPWSDYKYFIAAIVGNYSTFQIYKGVYLHP